MIKGEGDFRDPTQQRPPGKHRRGDDVGLAAVAAERETRRRRRAASVAGVAIAMDAG